MKYTKLLKLSAISLFSILASCGDKKDDHAGHDHDHGDHSGHSHDEKGEHAGHDHDNPEHDHTNCGVVVGPNGGRMIDEKAELSLNDKGQLTLSFSKAPSADTKVVLLIESEPLELTKTGNTYTSAPVADKLPAEVHVSIKSGDDKHVEKIKVEAGKCTKCKNAKLSCTCHNHDHGDKEDHKGHDHGDKDDHKGHDHGEDSDHSH